MCLTKLIEHRLFHCFAHLCISSHGYRDEHYLQAALIIMYKAYSKWEQGIHIFGHKMRSKPETCLNVHMTD